MEEIEQVKSLLKDIQERKFIITVVKRKLNKNNKVHAYGNKQHDVEKIKKDLRYTTTKEWLQKKYVIEEYSRNWLVKEYDLPISLSVFRKIIVFFDIQRRTLSDVTSRAKKSRSEKAQREYKNKTGWWKESVIRQNEKHTGRGIQGYYFNKSKQKYVWLRSLYEYIYAKWLDRNKLIWDVECRRYDVQDSIYKPDFFIFEKTKLVKIVEIKGYWDSGQWKVEELDKLLKIDVVIITKEEIKHYTIYNEHKEKNEWKQNRLKKLK